MSEYTEPGTQLEAITPSDSTDVTGVRGVYVGGDGDVAIMAIDDSTAVTFVGVTAGSIIPVRAKRIMSTNTTATNIVGIN